MTAMRQHIEDLEPQKWAELTKRAAIHSMETAQRLGLQPRPETVALAAMTEDQLVDFRERNGRVKTRLSPVMQLVEADQRSREAQRQTRDALQGQLDAQAAAAISRADAEESARIATAARERARQIESESQEKDRRRAQERATDQVAVQQARAETQHVRSNAASEINQVRADAAAEVAASHERVRAAEERAEQRAAERTNERSAAEQMIQELRTQIERLRADAAADVAAAREHVRAAEARADQRAEERTAERAAAEETIAQLRGEMERVRADAAAEVAAALGQARGEVDAMRRMADDEIASVRREAQTQVEEARSIAQTKIDEAHSLALSEIEDARSRAQSEVSEARDYALESVRQARAEFARITSVPATAPSQFLSVPIAPAGIRLQLQPIEAVLLALYRIDYVLEVGSAQPHTTLDMDTVRSLTQAVHEGVVELTPELAELPTLFDDPGTAESASAYASEAGAAYSALLARVERAAQQLSATAAAPADVAIAEAISEMLTDPWIQALRQEPA